MNINPQFIFNDQGAPSGVFLTIEEWKWIAESFHLTDDAASMLQEPDPQMNRQHDITTKYNHEGKHNPANAYDQIEAERFSRFQAGEEMSVPAETVQKTLRDAVAKVQR